MCKEKNPHVHAELIKAWADGADIQVKLSDRCWLDIDTPLWKLGREYRIKPEPSDLEKYGVKKGDVWLECDEDQHFVVDQDSCTIETIWGHAVSKSRLKQLLWRCGVVDKL